MNFHGFTGNGSFQLVANKSTIGMLGGMIGPMIDAAAVSAALPRTRSAGSSR